jgi:predicted DNA-binding transcriptional regulator AlpA
MRDSSKSQDVSVEPRVLNSTGAARYLGMSHAHFYRIRDAGTGPKSIRIPGIASPRYRVADLDAWLARCAKSPRAA